MCLDAQGWHLEWWCRLVGKGLHHTSLHTPRAVAQAQSLEPFSLVMFIFFPISSVILGIDGSLRFLLVSMWVIGVLAVISDLQRARSKVPHESEAIRLPTWDLC